MKQALLRWCIPLAALLVLGPAAGWLTSSLRSPDGGGDTTLLLCTAPISGVLAGLGAMGLALAAGCLAAYLISARSGLFASGLVLAWAAWGTGTIDQIIRRTGVASTFWTISIEGLLVGVLGVCVAAIVLAVGAMHHDGHPHNTDHLSRPRPSLARRIRDQFRLTNADADPDSTNPGSEAIGLLIALLCGAVGAWLIARESLKGQTFAAAAVAGLLGAGFGRIAAQHLTATMFFVVVAIAACAFPALAMFVNFAPAAGGGAKPLFMPSSEQVLAGVRAGMLLPLARPLPLDWIAGAFIGIPLGLSWAGSMVERHTPVPTAA